MTPEAERQAQPNELQRHCWLTRVDLAGLTLALRAVSDRQPLTGRRPSIDRSLVALKPFKFTNLSELVC